MDQARRRPTSGNISYQQGRAEALPLADGSADLVFMSMVNHHFANPTVVARECRRVLRSGGCACIRDGTSEATVPEEPFFPSLRGADRFRTAFEEGHRVDLRIGCVCAGRSSGRHAGHCHDWTSFVEGLALRADSLLACLSDDEFIMGLLHFAPMATRSTRMPPSAKRSTGSCLRPTDATPRAANSLQGPSTGLKPT